MTRPIVVVGAPLVAALLFAAGCGPGAPGALDDGVAFSLPQALVDCAAPPAGLDARMWVSGSAVPCDLEVSLDDGATTGACVVTPGRVRTLTIDWFAPSERGIDIVLAQAKKDIDLAQAEAASVALNIHPEDVATGNCRDMSNDQLEGALTVSFGGADVPVCDLDASCVDPLDPACSNLGELCAGADPFDPTVEP